MSYPMKYQAVLGLDGLKQFLDDFHDLESAKNTEITIHSSRECDNFTVTLIPKGVCADLLYHSFRDGLLRDWGWGEKFTPF